MARPQFTLKALLWLMAVVAVGCAFGPTGLLRTSHKVLAAQTNDRARAALLHPTAASRRLALPASQAPRSFLLKK